MARVLCILIILPFTYSPFCLGQSATVDSLKTKILQEVIITATRSERVLASLPMPVSLIPRSQIDAMGSLRLNEVLSEQTGLVVVPQVNAQGNGIQLQGFNPDYTLILIDGEPVIGRFSGSLELSRITARNISQIEIVKGPSSALYGSEALAGVINIITNTPSGTEGGASIRYATNNTVNFDGDVNHSGKNWGFHFFLNRYSTDGYDLSPESFGKTVSPFTHYNLSSKLNFKIGSRTDLSVSGRYFEENQEVNFEVLGSNGEYVRTRGSGKTFDYSVNPVITHRFTPNFKSILRFYGTQYSTETDLKLQTSGDPYYHDDFHQSFQRPELNMEYYFNDRHVLMAGAGFIGECVQTSRYGDQSDRHQQTAYGFFQYEWFPVSQLNVVGGGRWDHNSIYGSQFSPKLSARYEISKSVALKASVGRGFKAPDFRQLYFNFTNSAAGGYSVLGTEVIEGRLAELESQGQIQEYLVDPESLGSLQAERSWGINLGGTASLGEKITTDFNSFYNTIDNLIETQAVAITTAGQSIYSYRNVQRAFTSGLETDLTFRAFEGFRWSLGYQLLFAKDKDVAQEVRDGNVFYRDPNTLVTKRLQPSEYVGLYNRSRHTGNVKIFYNAPGNGIEASLRIIYRGKFGIGDIRGNIQGEPVPPSDINSNGILDKYDDFVPGYALVNVSVAKRCWQHFRFQVGIDNLFDYTEPVYIPNLPGRLLYANVSFNFSKNKSTNPN